LSQLGVVIRLSLSMSAPYRARTVTYNIIIAVARTTTSKCKGHVTFNTIAYVG